MAPVTPLISPPLDDLKNALQMVQSCMDSGDPAYWDDLNAIARLVRHAIEGLSEPNLSAMQAGEVLLAEWNGTPEPQRQLRDTLAGILHAQITGETPRTWSHE